MRLRAPIALLLVYTALALLTTAWAAGWRLLPHRWGHYVGLSLIAASQPGFWLGTELWRYAADSPLPTSEAYWAGVTVGLWLNATVVFVLYRLWRRRRRRAAA